LQISQFSAKTKPEIRSALRIILDQAKLPTERTARIFVKPNFNNDLNALTGNSTDLRLLWELCGELKERGYTNLALGDAPNTGTFRAGLDVLERLGVRRMCKLLQVECLDLNYCEAKRFPADGGVEARVARPILEADYVINVPKIKTHADAVLSCCVKNWMGINVGGAKWELHAALYENLVRNVALRPPDLCIVDGIIGMERDGPGDGDPVWMGVIIAGSDPFEIDVAIATAAGLDPRQIPYLSDYVRDHPRSLSNSEADLHLPELQPAPTRNVMARIATAPWLAWLRFLARPMTRLPATMQMFYRSGIVQDVYDPAERADRITVSTEVDSAFMQQWCPGNWDEIAATATVSDGALDVFSSSHCMRCYYCFWADIGGYVRGDIRSRYLKRHVARYRERVRTMITTSQ